MVDDLKKSQGFTLIELLLAISIFAIISVVAYSGLNTALQNQQRATQYAQRTAELQRALQRLEQNILQMVNRPIRNRWGETEPALVGESQQLTFTHNGGGNHAMLRGQKRSQLQRVAYQVRDEILVRDYWIALDQAQDSQAIAQPLLTQVKRFSLRYLDNKHQWHETWLQKALPIAVEVTLELNDIGKIQRLFELTDAIRYPVIITDKKTDKKTNGH